jgi:transposase
MMKDEAVTVRRRGALRYRAGIAWRDLPERFGHFRKVNTRFAHWSRTGVWQRVLEHLAQDADNEDALIDPTIVRTHQHSVGAKRGRWRPGARA